LSSGIEPVGVILTPSRWKLRKAVKTVQQTLNELKVEMHPDKTFVGRVAQGLAFLSCQMKIGGAAWSSPADSESIGRTYHPALRAGCILAMHWRLRSTLDGVVG
jgi:hypothetical protein